MVVKLIGAPDAEAPGPQLDAITVAPVPLPLVVYVGVLVAEYPVPGFVIEAWVMAPESAVTIATAGIPYVVGFVKVIVSPVIHPAPPLAATDPKDPVLMLARVSAAVSQTTSPRFEVGTDSSEILPFMKGRIAVVDPGPEELTVIAAELLVAP